MSTVGGVPGYGVTNTPGVAGEEPVNQAGGVTATGSDVVLNIPLAEGSVLTITFPENGLPILSDPLNSGLPLEQLVKALGLEGRNIQVRNGLDTLEAKGKERAEQNEKEIAEIQKQLEAMKEKEKLSPFMKAFKWIGIVFSAIAAAVTVAVGVLTANPLLVAGGVLLAVMAVNSIVSEASDGKYSIAAGVAELAKKCGASEETAQWIGMAVEMAVMIVGTVMTMGAGTAATAGSVAEKVISVATRVITMVNAGVMMANGGLKIADSVFQYDADMAAAMQKEIQAILERIQEALETETKLLEAVMQRAQDLLEKVQEVVKTCTEAQTVILTGQGEAPAPA